MKRVLYSLTIFLIITVLSVTNVNASNCSKEEKKNLKQEASSVEVLPYLDDEFNPLHKYYYSLNLINFSDKFYIKDSLGNRFEFSDEHKEDSRYGLYTPGTKVTIYIYAAYGETCSDELLKTYKINFEHYNDYSAYEECKGIEEFYLCKRNYKGKIESEEWFLKQVDAYKKGQIENIEEKPNKEEKWFDIIKEKIENNKEYIFAIVFILIVIAIYMIIKRNKRLKINLNKKRR